MRGRPVRWAAVFASAVLLGLLPAVASKPSGAKSGKEEALQPTPPPAITWAHIELKGEYPEGDQLPGLFGAVSETLGEALSRLSKAAEDDELTGVVLHLKSPSLGWARLHEFRLAIRRIRDAGKKVVAYMDDGSTTEYLLATACDEIVMPESGTLMLLGLRAEVTFYKNLFDLLGIKADMMAVGEFKSAGEPFTRTSMSPAFRKEMEELLDDLYGIMVSMIAEGRHLSEQQVQAAIDSGPHLAHDAKKLGLIDHVAYEDQLKNLLRGKDEQAEVSLVRRYGKKKVDTDFSGFAGMVKMMNLLMGVETPRKSSKAPKIAVIHANGVIVTGKSSTDLLGTSVLGSDTLVKAIRTAADDETVKAIVLRVDSPGGSALASDLIWRALKQADKPVVVSMGDVAASGGYYISMGADYIFAEPGTLTGSIGVVGGKFALKGLYDKIGVTTEVLTRGKNSGLLSSLEGFSDSEREAMKRMLEGVYEQFVRKAAAGRKMEYEKLEALARGRVYSGKRAVELGLVDALGTLDDAVEHARKLAGLKDDEEYERLILPRATSPLEQLFGPLDPETSALRAMPPQTRAMLMLSGELRSHGQSVWPLVRLLENESTLLVLPYRLVIR